MRQYPPEWCGARRRWRIPCDPHALAFPLSNLNAVQPFYLFKFGPARKSNQQNGDSAGESWRNSLIKGQDFWCKLVFQSWNLHIQLCMQSFILPSNVLSRTCSILEGWKEIQLALLRSVFKVLMCIQESGVCVFFHYVKGVVSKVVWGFSNTCYKFCKIFSHLVSGDSKEYLCTSASVKWRVLWRLQPLECKVDEVISGSWQWLWKKRVTFARATKSRRNLNLLCSQYLKVSASITVRGILLFLEFIFKKASYKKFSPSSDSFSTV